VVAIDPSPEQPTSPAWTTPPDSVDGAWRVLGLVSDWIRHAEAKAGVCLAAAGFIGGVLFQLVVEHDRDRRAQALALICAGWVCLACGFAGLSLWPRLRDGGPPTSVIYFGHIARDRSGGRRASDAMAAYVNRLHATMTDPDALMTAVGGQIWANARVARRKYRWASLALLCMLLALATLGATAFAVIART
jgi:Family of unknown function (DUF5706)